MLIPDFFLSLLTNPDLPYKFNTMINGILMQLTGFVVYLIQSMLGTAMSF